MGSDKTAFPVVLAGKFVVLSVLIKAAAEMEFSLHRQLKHVYAADDALVEVRLGAYRIDVVIGDELVEIQHGSFAAIRDKVARLLETHAVRVVKPIVVNKLLVKRARKGGRVLEHRKSPKRGTVLDLFEELVYFTRVFPHPRLTLEVVLVDVEEWRYPGHGRRRRRRERDFIIEDQKLVTVHQTVRIASLADLRRLVECVLPAPFHTGDLALGLAVSRPIAQRIAYCLRKVGAVDVVGKQGNAWLYAFSAATEPVKKRRRKAG